MQDDDLSFYHNNFSYFDYRMTRNSQRQANRRQWGEDSLKAAMQVIEEGSPCCKAASIAYNIPEATLRRYRNKKPRRIELAQHAGILKSTFNTQQTRHFVKYLTDCNCHGLGLTSSQVG